MAAAVWVLTESGARFGALELTRIVALDSEAEQWERMRVRSWVSCAR